MMLSTIGVRNKNSMTRQCSLLLSITTRCTTASSSSSKAIVAALSSSSINNCQFCIIPPPDDYSHYAMSVSSVSSSLHGSSKRVGLCHSWRRRRRQLRRQHLLLPSSSSFSIGGDDASSYDGYSPHGRGAVRQQQSQHQRRYFSSDTAAASSLLADISFWGGTGLLLTNFHTILHIPYWSCIVLTNIVVRTAMIPIAVHGARTQVKLGSVSPEVQYLITSFTTDMTTLGGKQAAATATGGQGGQKSKSSYHVDQMYYKGRIVLIKATMETLRGIYRMKDINPLAIFKSPALQIPVFIYFAMDLRKIIEGSDPLLAQKLVESNFLWLTDLTEPDPWYGLPIATGALLYLNVEMSVGKQALSGEASSKSNIAQILKDVFQSLAIFMPCFMAQQPSGVQLYLLTSMIFTLAQARAMRNDVIRAAIGLPSIHAKARNMSDSDIVKNFLEQMSERQAAKARGGYVLGEGVHVTGANISIPRFGKKRPSSIIVVDDSTIQGGGGGGSSSSSRSSKDRSNMISIELPDHTLRSPLLVQPQMFATTPIPYMHGMTTSVLHHTPRTTNFGNEEELLSMPDIPLSAIEAANRGEMPQQVTVVAGSTAGVEMAPKEVLRQIEESKRKRMGSGPINKSKLKSRWKSK